MIKLGILTTHPIQYQVPWFRALAMVDGLDLTVFFCMIPNGRQQGKGFGVSFQWDVPLMEGYPYRVLENVSKFPSVASFFGCDTPGIRCIVENGDFDAFIANGWVAKSCLQLLAACRRYRVPCIVRGESNSLRKRPWWKKVSHRLLLNGYSAFLFIGKANREFYLQNGVEKERLFFAPYCVDNDRFASASRRLVPERRKSRERWGIPKDAFVFLFCGKFVEKKRPRDLLSAFEILARQSEAQSVHLLFAGSGRLLSRCRGFAEKRNLPVTFAGFLNQSEIVRAYAAADCLVLPSDDGETWGLVVNEAMACGLPAIVSDRVGCHPDLIVPGATGEIHRFGDAEALADRLAAMARDPLRSRKMGKAARRLVGGYCYEKVVEGTMAALDFATRGK